MTPKHWNFLLRNLPLAVVLTATFAQAASDRGYQPAMQTTIAQLAERVAGVWRGTHRVIDLTYSLAPDTPAYPGEPPLAAEVAHTYDKDGYFDRRFCTAEHYGTHMDAPAHFTPGQLTLDAIPVRQFFAPAVVVDVSAKVAQDADYRLTRADLVAWEEAHEQIPVGAVVIARTGWGARWNDPARYLNADANGTLHFPGFSVEATRFLVEERRIAGLGIDTLSMDYGPSTQFEVHRITFPHGLYMLENLANLELLPEKGAFLVVAPIKLAGGSGGPTRVYALLP